MTCLGEEAFPQSIRGVSAPWPASLRQKASACRRAYGADFGIGVTGTMGNTDPANSDSVPGEVYAAIENEFGCRAFSFTLEPQSSRHMYKLAVCDRIADELIDVVLEV